MATIARTRPCKATVMVIDDRNTFFTRRQAIPDLKLHAGAVDFSFTHCPGMTRQPTTPFAHATWAGSSSSFWILPAITLALSLLVTALAYTAARAGATRNDEASLARLSDRVLSQIKARVDSANEAVYGARAHVITTERVTRASWSAYSAAALPSVGEGLVGLG